MQTYLFILLSSMLLVCFSVYITTADQMASQNRKKRFIETLVNILDCNIFSDICFAAEKQFLLWLTKFHLYSFVT